MEDNSKKQDRRVNNGGTRPGAGRPAGSGKSETKNKTIRVPKKMIDEAKEKGVKNLTKLIVAGASKELKKIPYPSGSKANKKGGSPGTAPTA